MNCQPRDIAQFVADGRPGGGTTVVLALVDALRADPRWRVTVIGQPGSFLADEASRRGVPFVGVDLFRSPFDPLPPWRLARLLGERRFALTHLHGVRAAHQAVQAPLRRHLGQLVYTVHGLHQLHQGPLLRALTNHAERRVMRRVYARVFVAQADWQAARDWRLLAPGQAAQLIVNGVDVAGLSARTRQDRACDVVYVARHVEQKQPELAARALARLAQAGWRCAMAGGGDLLPAVQALLATLPGGDRVSQRGELTHAQALEFLADARVVLLPSRWEGLPVLPMEAMALGVVPVASSIPGHQELIEHGRSGLLVEAAEDALVAAVQAVLSSPDEERRLREGGLQRVSLAFDHAAMVARYLDLYDAGVAQA